MTLVRSLGLIVLLRAVAATPAPAQQTDSVSRVVAGRRQAAHDSALAAFARFATVFPTLDARRAALVGAARRDSASAAGDSAFLRGRAALNAAIDITFREIDISALSDREITRFTDACRRHGVVAMLGEGFMDLAADDSTLRAEAARYLTPAMARFLAFEALDEREAFAGDAAMLPWDAAERHIAFADQLLVDAPDFAAAGVLRPHYTWELAMYLHGVDNTPVFTRDTRALAPGARASYEHYVATHRDLPSAKIVARYLDLLRANGWKFTPAIAAFWKQTFPGEGLMNAPPL